jgi:hypothetical protein
VWWLRVWVGEQEQQLCHGDVWLIVLTKWCSPGDWAGRGCVTPCVKCVRACKKVLANGTAALGVT